MAKKVLRFQDYDGFDVPRGARRDTPMLSVAKGKGNGWLNAAATKIAKKNGITHVKMAHDHQSFMGAVRGVGPDVPHSVELKETGKGTMQIGQAGKYFRDEWSMEFDVRREVPIRWNEKERLFEFDMRMFDPPYSPKPTTPKLVSKDGPQPPKKAS